MISASTGRDSTTTAKYFREVLNAVRDYMAWSYGALFCVLLVYCLSLGVISGVHEDAYMSQKLSVLVALFLKMVVCFVCIMLFLIAKGARRRYWPLGLILIFQEYAATVDWLLLFHRQWLQVSPMLAYSIYFYSEWIGSALIALLTILLVGRIYSTLMEPLIGLRLVGMWVLRGGGVACYLVAFVALVSGNDRSGNYFVAGVSALEESQSVLVLCLIIWLVFVLSPLGFSYRSRIFGVSLGLGVSATASLVTPVLFSDPSFSIYSFHNAFSTLGGLAAPAIWCVYFVMPEPARRLVILPVRSPVQEPVSDETVVYVKNFQLEELNSAERKPGYSATIKRDDELEFILAILPGHRAGR